MTKRETTHQATLDLGPCVVDGELRWLSATIIGQGDERQDGGCLRHLHFMHVAEMWEDSTASQSTGTALHLELAHYLKTGERALSQVALAGIHLLPDPGADLRVEESMLRVANDLSTAKMWIEGIPVAGHRDLVHDRGTYVDPQGELRADDPFGTVEVLDHKSTKSFEWMKSGPKLRETVQMVLYGAHALIEYPDAPGVRLSHVYYKTQGKPEARKSTIWCSREEIAGRMESIAEVVRSIREAVRVPRDRSNSVRANERACPQFRGCPRGQDGTCNVRTSKSLAELLGERSSAALTRTLTDVTGRSAARDQPTTERALLEWRSPANSHEDARSERDAGKDSPQHAAEVQTDTGSRTADARSAGASVRDLHVAALARLEGALDRSLPSDKACSGNTLPALQPSTRARERQPADTQQRNRVSGEKMALIDVLNPAVTATAPAAPAPVATLSMIEQLEAEEAAAIAASKATPVGAPPTPSMPKLPAGFVEACKAIEASGLGFPTMSADAGAYRAAMHGHVMSANAALSGTGRLAKINIRTVPELLQLAQEATARAAKLAAAAAASTPPAAAQAPAQPAPVSMLPPDAPASSPELAAKPVEGFSTPVDPVAVAVVTDALAGLPADVPTPAEGVAAATVAEQPAKKRPGRPKKQAAAPTSTDAGPVQTDENGDDVETDGGFELYINAIPSTPYESLDSYIAGMCESLCKRYECADVRCAPKGSPLEYANWKGVVAAMARARPPKYGTFVIHTTSEIHEIVADALSTKASLYVRGVKS